jgi:hypothetical protein
MSKQKVLSVPRKTSAAAATGPAGFVGQVEVPAGKHPLAEASDFQGRAVYKVAVGARSLWISPSEAKRIGTIAAG